MSARTRLLAPIAIATAFALPSTTFAQRPAPADVGPGGNPVAPLIDMRRELNLSSRQVAALDSIERTLRNRNRTASERLEARRDSIMRQGRDVTTREEWEGLRTRLDSLRPLREQIGRNDSTARAAAMAVLTDSQRVRVREMQAQRRGFAQGRSMDRRGMDGPRGMRRAQGMRGMRGMRQGGARGMRDRAMPQRPRGFRGQPGPEFRRRIGPPGFGNRMGPQGPGGRMMGPEARDRMMPGPRRPMGPLGMGMRRPGGLPMDRPDIEMQPGDRPMEQMEPGLRRPMRPLLDSPDGQLRRRPMRDDSLPPPPSPRRPPEG